MNWLNGAVILINLINCLSGVIHGNALQAALSGMSAALLGGIMLAAWVWMIDPETARRRWNREK